MILFLCAQDLREIWIGLIEKGLFSDLNRFERTPEQYLATLDEFVRERAVKFHELSGICVVTGPGSFTSSRISLTIANALHFIYNCPISTLENSQYLSPVDLIQQKGVGTMLTSKEFAHSSYDRAPHITKPSRVL